MNEKIYILGFSAFPGVGTIRFNSLIKEAGSSQKAWEADEKVILNVLKDSVGKKFLEFRKTFNLKKYAEKLKEKGITFLIPTDKNYPKLLTKLPQSPFILFAKGNGSLLTDEKTIGIVGTRKVSGYGREATEMLTRDLVANGFTTVSGMAFGVDSIVHKETLKNNGKTIAVLGSGVDVPTPREHANLYKEILENNGLIVSTFSPGEGAHVGSFPARNAIIAGLSLGVVVTEGAEDSGSLITANYAKKFERPVFSVPGQITSNLSKGTNNLIKDGATPISSVKDILDSLGIMETPKLQKGASYRKTKTTKEEQEVIAILENGPLHFDEIVRTIGKDSKEIGSLLSLMELKGLIKSDTDGKYSL